MARPSKDNSKKVLSISNFPLALKQRLRLECLRRDCVQSEIIIEILDRNLPHFPEVFEDKAADNGASKQKGVNGGVSVQSGLFER